MAEYTNEPIINTDQTAFLQNKGREIAQNIVDGNYTDVVYLDKSARPLRLFVDMNISPNQDIQSSFLSVGKDQVLGYFNYLHEMSKNDFKEYHRRFSKYFMYLNNIYTMYGFEPGFTRTQWPKLEADHLELQAIHEFFNEEDIKKIQSSIKKRSIRLGNNKLKVYFIDDLEGSGITLQFARALIEVLGQEIGIEVKTMGKSFLGFLSSNDKNLEFFQKEVGIMPHMPWAKFGSKDEQEYHFISDAGSNRLISGKILEPKQRTRATSLYKEIKRDK